MRSLAPPLARRSSKRPMPRQKHIASSILDLPLPFRPVIALKVGSHGEITVRTAYDLKPSMISSVMRILAVALGVRRGNDVSPARNHHSRICGFSRKDSTRLSGSPSQSELLFAFVNTPFCLARRTARQPRLPTCPIYTTLNLHICTTPPTLPWMSSVPVALPSHPRASCYVCSTVVFRFVFKSCSDGRNASSAAHREVGRRCQPVLNETSPILLSTTTRISNTALQRPCHRCNGLGRTSRSCKCNCQLENVNNPSKQSSSFHQRSRSPAPTGPRLASPGRYCITSRRITPHTAFCMAKGSHLQTKLLQIDRASLPAFRCFRSHAAHPHRS